MDTIDFGDLSNDKKIVESITNVHKSVAEIERFLTLGYNSEIYKNLDTLDKVDFDLFIAYSLNTLYWVFLRTKGIDPSKTDVKKELDRIKDYMLKAKQARERITIRPRLDKDASKRFLKHALSDVQNPPNKKIKFEDEIL